MALQSKKQKDLALLEKTRVILANDLPAFCYDYFIAIEPRTSVLTRYNYAHDLRLFFHYAVNEIFISLDNPSMNIPSLRVDCLDQITVSNIEYFLDYLSLYDRQIEPHNDDQVVTRQNQASGKARKLAAIRSLYKYYYKKEMIKKNPAALVDTPKIAEKEITRLEIDEIARLLDEIESGSHLSTHAQKYYRHNRTRDIALISLFLGTGVRVSECVNLDIRDVDFEVNGIRIIRKGGKQAVVYFSDEIARPLTDYIQQRKEIVALDGHENALFLSMQKRRISVVAVQNIVKKYSAVAAPLKRISPHKLRSTYGTQLYRNTGDIYLVAEVLGHRDVNTTKKHYAAIAEDRRRSAANAVKLREDNRPVQD